MNRQQQRNTNLELCTGPEPTRRHTRLLNPKQLLPSTLPLATPSRTAQLLPQRRSRPNMGTALPVHRPQVFLIVAGR